MSLMEYIQKDDGDFQIIKDIMKSFKSKNDNVELNQILDFLINKVEKISIEIPSVQKKKELVKNVTAKEKDYFEIKSFKITSTALYLITGEKEALVYQFDKDTIKKCYEIINSGFLYKKDIGIMFKKECIKQ